MREMFLDNINKEAHNRIELQLQMKEDDSYTLTVLSDKERYIAKCEHKLARATSANERVQCESELNHAKSTDPDTITTSDLSEIYKAHVKGNILVRAEYSDWGFLKKKT